MFEDLVAGFIAFVIFIAFAYGVIEITVNAMFKILERKD